MPKLKSPESHALGGKAEENARMKEAMSGDMVLEISPVTVNKQAASAAWTRTVSINLKNAAGKLHSWFNGVLAVAIADTSILGTASIVSQTPAMVNGVCTVIISGNAAAWVADETDTLTLSNKVILGYTVAGGTSVQTFTA